MLEGAQAWLARPSDESVIKSKYVIVVRCRSFRQRQRNFYFLIDNLEFFLSPYQMCNFEEGHFNWGAA